MTSSKGTRAWWGVGLVAVALGIITTRLVIAANGRTASTGLTPAETTLLVFVPGIIVVVAVFRWSIRRVNRATTRLRRAHQGATVFAAALTPEGASGFADVVGCRVRPGVLHFVCTASSFEVFGRRGSEKLAILPAGILGFGSSQESTLYGPVAALVLTSQTARCLLFPASERARWFPRSMPREDVDHLVGTLRTMQHPAGSS